MLCLDISTIEAKHASNREVSLLRSRGWVPSLATLSASFVSKTVASAVAQVQGAFKASRRSKKLDKDGCKAPKPKRGGGGAWRAFVRHTCQGSRMAMGGFSELAKAYRALSPEDRAFYQEAGEKATLAHKEGHESFGPRTRRQPHRQSIYDHPATRPAPGTLTESGALVGTTAEIDRSLQLQCFGSQDVPTEFENLKARVNQERKQASVELTAEEEQEVLGFQRDVSDAFIVEGLTETEHTETASSFLNLGSSMSSLVSLEWFPPVGRVVQLVMDKAAASIRRVFQLDLQLRTRFTQGCQLIRESDGDNKIPKTLPGFQPSLCFTYGVCVCKAHPDVPHLFTNCMRFFKTAFWKKKKLKQAARLRLLLEQHKVVVEFRRNEPPASSGEGGDAWDKIFEACLEDGSSETRSSAPVSTSRVFGHISRINFKTWHFAIMRLDPVVDDAKHCLVLEPCHAAECRSRHALYTDMELFAYTFTPDVPWRMRFHVISERDEDWLLLLPGQIPVRLATDFAECIFWQGSTQEAARRSIAQPRPPRERKRAQRAGERPRQRPRHARRTDNTPSAVEGPPVPCLE